MEEGGLEEFVPGFATDAGGGREEHEQRRAAQEDEAPSGGRRGASRRSEEGAVPGGGCGVERTGRMSAASRAAGGWCSTAIRRGEGAATAGWCGSRWVGGGERRATQTGARPGGQNRVREVVRWHVGWMARV